MWKRGRIDMHGLSNCHDRQVIISAFLYLVSIVLFVSLHIRLTSLFIWKNNCMINCDLKEGEYGFHIFYILSIKKLLWGLH